MKSIEFLYSLQSFGIKLGLNNIRALLEFLGNPHTTYPVIHVAGTNGKGSTSAMISACLTASGYKTGLYTSPHLVHFNERIRINGKKITIEQIEQYARELKPVILQTKATFFEATTALAFAHFAHEKVDIAVIETGLGGRFDATNVVTPALSIITTIGFDHMEQLGTTLAGIASEKAGIIKSGAPCFTAVTQKPALQSIATAARKNNTTVIRAQKQTQSAIERNDIFGLQLTLKTPSRNYKALQISLPGEHQAMNARLAVLAVEYMKEQYHYSRISEDSIRAGLADIQALAGLHGRMEVVNTNPTVIVDVGHNAEGIATALQALQRLHPYKPLVVFGVMKDKQYEEMIQTLCSYARLVIAVQPDTERALESRRIVEYCHTHRAPALDGKSVARGMNIATSLVRSDEAILVLGSHYVAGEAIQTL